MSSIQKSKKDYTQITNTILNDKNISLKAKGLFAFMDSKPDGWNFTIASMSSQLKDGQDSIKSALKELKEFGYVVYHRLQSGHGIYELVDNPKVGFPNPKVEKPHEGNPQRGKPPRISNKEPLVKKIVSGAGDGYSGGSPTEDQVIAAGKKIGISPEVCTNFWLHYESKKWRGILDFIPLLRKWAMNEKPKDDKKEKVKLWA